MELFHGLITALVTPFVDNQLDTSSFLRLLQSQAQYADGVVIGGTTGESPTISKQEVYTMVQLAQQVYNGKILVGISGNNTHACIEQVQHFEQVQGIDGYLIVAPYYNKPNQTGIVMHFSHIAQHTQRPIVLYSIPGRCAVEIGIESVVQLQKMHKNIVGIKEATDNCARVDDLVRCMPPDFAILSGNDNMTLPFMSIGAHGAISACSNVLPKEIKQLINACNNNQYPDAREIHKQIILRMRALFMEPNPVAIKHMLAKMGIISAGDVRLPMVASSKDKLQTIESFFL